jgi:hypothetical protein
MIILAGRDQFAERVVHFVAENAAEYIGREYFGAIGAIVVPLAAYFALKRFEIKRQSDAIEPEENKDILKELGNQLERGVLIVSLRAAICGLKGLAQPLLAFPLRATAPTYVCWEVTGVPKLFG